MGALLRYFCAAAGADRERSHTACLQALLLVAAATLAKETGFTFLGAFVAYEWLAEARPAPPRIVPRLIALRRTVLHFTATSRIVPHCTGNYHW